MKGMLVLGPHHPALIGDAYSSVLDEYLLKRHWHSSSERTDRVRQTKSEIGRLARPPHASRFSSMLVPSSTLRRYKLWKPNGISRSANSPKTVGLPNGIGLDYHWALHIWTQYPVISASTSACARATSHHGSRMRKVAINLRQYCWRVHNNRYTCVL